MRTRGGGQNCHRIDPAHDKGNRTTSATVVVMTWPLLPEFCLQTAPHRGKSETLEGTNVTLFWGNNLVVFGESYRESELFLRGGASMRFHPNRRASMDQRPGPNIARAAAVVPTSSHTHLSPGTVSIFQISINAIEVPTIGVHKPATSSNPAPIKSRAGIVTFIGGRSVHSLKPARTISTEPTTTRMRSNPAPGHPPANVEYSLRNYAPFST